MRISQPEAPRTVEDARAILGAHCYREEHRHVTLAYADRLADALKIALAALDPQKKEAA